MIEGVVTRSTMRDYQPVRRDVTMSEIGNDPGLPGAAYVPESDSRK
jgi:hypothetical protein